MSFNLLSQFGHSASVGSEMRTDVVNYPTVTVDVATIARIRHREAMQITAAENTKFGACLAGLTPQQWGARTECDRWDVRAVAAHVIGAAAAQVSPREFVRQVRTGKPFVAEIGAQYWWDGMNELQVRERADASTDQLRQEWADTAPNALKARSKLPKPIANLPLLKLPAPVGRARLKYLFDMGFTRDVWMHRIDIAVAIGALPDLDGDHDGRIVADLVAEWAETHGEPFVLELVDLEITYVSGVAGEHVQISTIDFARILSGRADGDGVLRHPLPL
ncbi:maleylpyruvate isomerase family mycothiol-dependent enzyme [Ilumatobacter sp.]|uniref:maleylpyruvate isomerase family mycothiol-dependent enzyme n=1 Tax=Ilumatobacter sp. TaxID=1967498 RepID=UPI003C343ED3